MKKLVKVLGLLAMSLVLCLGVVAFAACGGDKEEEATYTGQYHYANPWGGADYGVKVNVTIKSETITKVEIADSDFVVVTSTWTDRAYWDEGVDALLASYVGKTVDEVLAIKVTTNPETVGSADTYFSAIKGQPDNEQTLGGLVITNATQGSARLLLAVQNAINSRTEKTYAGEYHYANPWGGADYGVKVNVTVKENKITKLEIAESSYVVVTDTWTDKAYWEDGVDGLLASYVGKTINEVLAINVTTNPETVGSVDTYFSAIQGQPDNEQTLGGLVITNATQGSGRLLLAVQNALANL